MCIKIELLFKRVAPRTIKQQAKQRRIHHVLQRIVYLDSSGESNQGGDPEGGQEGSQEGGQEGSQEGGQESTQEGTRERGQEG